jgi:sphingomyelin phosphodiesterase
MLAFHPWLFIVFILSSCAAGSLLDEILTAFKNAIDCGSCHALLVPLKVLALLGNSAFVNTTITLCETFKVRTAFPNHHSLIDRLCVNVKLEDEDVCQGLFREQGPIIAHDLRQISPFDQTGTLICDAVFGLCQAPAVNPHTVHIPNAAPVRPKVWRSSGRAPFHVLHFSDVHIDRQYTVTSHLFNLLYMCV